MKKIKLKPFLAVSSVFLLAASVFIPTQNIIQLKANGIEINGDNKDVVITDIMSFDWVRVVSTDSDDSYSDINYYNAVMSMPTSFFVPTDLYGNLDYESFYSNIEIYSYSPDYSLTVNSSVTVKISPNNMGSLSDYFFDLSLYGLYNFPKNIFYFYANEIVIENDRIDYLENNFNLCYFSVNGFGGLYSIENFISSASLFFTLNYYDPEAKVLKYEEFSFNVSNNNYFILGIDNIMYWAPFNDLLSFIDYGVINEWTDSIGYLTLSDVYLVFNFDYVQSGPPIQLHYYSRALNSFEKPAIIDVYSSKIYYNPLPEIRVSDFITTAVSGFLDFSIIPGLSFGSILAIMISIPIVIAFLKYFVGG